MSLGPRPIDLRKKPLGKDNIREEITLNLSTNGSRNYKAQSIYGHCGVGATINTMLAAVS